MYLMAAALLCLEYYHVMTGTFTSYALVLYAGVACSTGGLPTGAFDAFLVAGLAVLCAFALQRHMELVVIDAVTIALTASVLVHYACVLVYGRTFADMAVRIAPLSHLFNCMATSLFAVPAGRALRVCTGDV